MNSLFKTFQRGAKDPSKELFESLSNHTYLSKDRLLNLVEISKRISERQIPGDFVECGTYKGGSAAILGKYMGPDRHLWLYDSFQGMPNSSTKDGPDAAKWVSQCVASLTDVQAALSLGDVALKDCTIREGWFADTFKEPLPEKVAVLHCDADWYDSVTAVLETFYDRVAEGGYIILDDFGYWEGCREAAYDFWNRRGIKPLLERVGVTQAFWIKGKTHNRT